jgi:hypothetical protein
MTMLIFIAQYKGFKIRNKPPQRLFDILAEDGQSLVTLTSVKDCRSWIDKQLNIRFKKTPVIYRTSFQSAFHFGKATSCNEHAIRITDSESKCNTVYPPRDVYEDNEENQDLVTRISLRQKEIVDLREEIRQLIEELTPFNPKTMIDRGEHHADNTDND